MGQERVSYLLYENRGRPGQRQALHAFCKPKDRSWTEVTYQQVPGKLETRPSPTSITLLANRITTTFCSLFGRKDIVSVIFAISLLENHLERPWEMLQEWGFSPQLSRCCYSQGALCRQHRQPCLPTAVQRASERDPGAWPSSLGLTVTKI